MEKKQQEKQKFKKKNDFLSWVKKHILSTHTSTKTEIKKKNRLIVNPV